MDCWDGNGETLAGDTEICDRIDISGWPNDAIVTIDALATYLIDKGYHRIGLKWNGDIRRTDEKVCAGAAEGRGFSVSCD